MVVGRWGISQVVHADSRKQQPICKQDQSAEEPDTDSRWAIHGSDLPEPVYQKRTFNTMKVPKLMAAQNAGR